MKTYEKEMISNSNNYTLIGLNQLPHNYIYIILYYIQSDGKVC